MIPKFQQDKLDKMKVLIKQNEEIIELLKEITKNTKPKTTLKERICKDCRGANHCGSCLCCYDE